MQARIIKLLTFLACLLAFSGYSQPFSCGGDFYMVLANAGGNSQLYNVLIDPLTEEVIFDPISTGGAGERLNAIGYRPTDNYIYGINPSTFELNRIGANGIATPLATLLDLNFSAGYFAADITPDGQYLVLLAAFGSPLASQEMSFVDLSDPAYPVTSIPLQSSADFLSTDIAFDPLSGILYGYDKISGRLITIDPLTGEVDLEKYPAFDEASGMGALFFDSFGRLYGYGDQSFDFEARTLFKLDTQTGRITALAEGPIANEKDGCSCPYTVRLEKTVSPEVALPCTEVEYAFQLANASAVDQLDIVLFDEMPALFTITEIVRNPYGGIITSGVGTNILTIEGMVVPPGIDSVVVKVEIGPTALGIYANQATLSGLPLSLGEETISDNPKTLQSMDSTLLEIIPLRVDLEKDSVPLCGDDQLFLDVTTHGATYQWSNGATEATQTIATPGWYSVTVSTPCAIDSDSVWVEEVEIAVSLGDDLEIAQGEEVKLSSMMTPPNGLSLSWTDPLGNTLSCYDCEEPIARPLQEVTYTLEVDNGLGCIDSDDIRIRVIKVRGVYAPNAFSPNGDGANDFFYLQGPQDFDVLEFRVFNRWGAAVFAAQNIKLNEEQLGWNGYFQGKPLNPDVFAWYAIVEYPDGEREMLEGDVLIWK